MESLTVDMFAPHRGSRFRIVADADQVVDASLVEADSMAGSVGDGGRAPFRLLFHGPATPILPQRIYRFEHDTLAPLDLFIVPVGPAGDRMQYEAIFS
jgi:hypothetical protein